MSKNAPSNLFPQRLRRARDIRGLDQARLAAKAGLPASSISHFEVGSRKPSFENLGRLANALNVTTDYLLGRANDPEANAEADPIYRDFKNRSEEDRENIKLFMKFLEERSKKGKEK